MEFDPESDAFLVHLSDGGTIGTRGLGGGTTKEIGTEGLGGGTTKSVDE